MPPKPRYPLNSTSPKTHSSHTSPKTRPPSSVSSNPRTPSDSESSVVLNSNLELNDLFNELKGDNKRMMIILMKQFESLRYEISVKNNEITQLNSQVVQLQKKGREA